MTATNTDPMASPDPTRLGYVIHSVSWLQRALNRLGFCVGAQDGFWGSRTQGGLDRYIAARNLPAGSYYVNGPQTMEVMLHQQVSERLSREQLPATSRCLQRAPAPVPVPAFVPASVTSPVRVSVASGSKTGYIVLGVGVALLTVVGLMWLAGRKR